MRKVKNSIDIATLDDYKKNCQPPIQWHSLTCTLVTPMYGGGVRSTVVDKKMPIRVTGIRGQLRFWWRLLAKQKWYSSLSNEDICKKEFALWGGMADNKDTENDGKASLVMLRVRDVKQINVEPWAKYVPRPNNPDKDRIEYENWAKVPYALFPAKGRTEKNPDEEPHSLLREGCQWTLDVAFMPQATLKSNDIVDDKNDRTFEDEVWETIRWWANFGGIGSRTRRGLGAIKIDSNDKISVVTKDELQDIGLRFKMNPANNPYTAWKLAVSKLQEFRQGMNVARTKSEYTDRNGNIRYKPGRSWWSEPDAIRDKTEQTLATHASRITTGNIFPRAAFGLPINFKFKDGGDNSNNDPQTTVLTAKYYHDEKWIDFERLASPLILRPYLDKSGRWNALALCLPEKLGSDNNIQLVLKNNKKPEDTGYLSKKVEYWDVTQASDIKPLDINGEIQKPLTAFLTYFSK